MKEVIKIFIYNLNLLEFILTGLVFNLSVVLLLLLLYILGLLVVLLNFYLAKLNIPLISRFARFLNELFAFKED